MKLLKPADFFARIVWICLPLLLAVQTGWAAGDFGAGYRTDQILIKPRVGINSAVLTSFHAALGAKAGPILAGAGGSQIIAVPAGETVAACVARYQASGLVEFAEPDYIGQIYSTTPNDPKYLDGSQWGLNSIDAADGWSVLTSASNIVVAVLDTGVRYTHEDLASNMWVNPLDGGHGWNTLTQNNNPADDSGHGTMVAGVLGAVGNNGKGVTGVAWRVQIMACKCFNSFGLGSVSDVAVCLDYARTNGARLINASWGFTNSLTLSNAISALRDAGILLVAACGNNASNIDVAPVFPAGYALDNVVSVASLTRTNTLSATSNYGATNVDLAAPGEYICSTFAASDSYYYTNSGTSLAAPYVTGALALMLAKYPAENYQQIRQRLLTATDPLPALAGKCATGGRLNLRKALNPDIWLTATMPGNPGACQLHLATGANRQCVIQMSTNLVNWTPVFTNTTPAGGAFDYTNSTPLSQHFFRASGSL